MNINQVREELHKLIDEIDDLYVLNGLYRNLAAEKRHKAEYDKEQAAKNAKASARRTKRGE